MDIHTELLPAPEKNLENVQRNVGSGSFLFIYIGC